ncbi:MAG: hypothetical protein WC704_11315 [Sphingomonas sp.]
MTGSDGVMSSGCFVEISQAVSAILNHFLEWIGTDQWQMAIGNAGLGVARGEISGYPPP